jgi:hypothetical protein
MAVHNSTYFFHDMIAIYTYIHAGKVIKSYFVVWPIKLNFHKLECPWPSIVARLCCNECDCGHNGVGKDVAEAGTAMGGMLWVGSEVTGGC